MGHVVCSAVVRTTDGGWWETVGKEGGVRRKQAKISTTTGSIRQRLCGALAS